MNAQRPKNMAPRYNQVDLQIGTMSILPDLACSDNSHASQTESVADMDYRPSKERVLAWLQQRQGQPGPLPGIEQIQRELGWDFAEKEQEPGNVTAEDDPDGRCCC